jgi:phosphoribosylformimino-5-aminoimidazole carboxamide ribonucleotide (ProFAR) isomerase
MEDLERLASIKIYAVIVGKAIYEGRISLEELQGFDDRRTMQ